MDPDLDPDPHGSGTFALIRGIIVPDPAKNLRADFISHFRPVNSGLCVL